MGNGRTDLFKNKIVVLVAFISIAFILFSSSTGRIFLSDDYCTLHNIVSNHRILLRSFFRPVGDLTLKWTYQLAGWDPFYFYVVNIIIHAINSFLLYLFCRKWFANESRAGYYALIAGLIFLTYPSHSEAILWAIGRGISLAVFFSLLAMITFISKMNVIVKYFLVSLFYFIALACYESAILLPFILFILPGGNIRRNRMIWPIALLATLLFHLYLRYQFTGGIWQAYDGDIFSRDIIQYLDAFIKIIIRLFVPPFNHPLFFSICGIVAMIILFMIIRRNRNRFESDSIFTKTIILSLTGLLVTTIVAISFGISTRTSEGDRLMYFPSVFYAMFIALLIVRLIPSVKTIILTTILFLIFQISFLLINQQHWIRASEYAVKVINAIGAHPQRPLYIINLPSDHKGAYVFRNCLPKALLHYHIDTAGIKVVNIIQSTEADKRKTLIAPEKKGDNLFIWPNTLIEMRNGIVISINGDTSVKGKVLISSFLYWNKEDLVPFSNYFNSR